MGTIPRPRIVSRSTDLEGEKGVDVLIQAIGRLGQYVRLEIAGDGPQRRDLEELAALAAPGRVHFLGHIDAVDLRQLIRSALVVAVPSRFYENQPMVILEALGCGVPVVATSLGGNIELVITGLNGALIPPNDPTALASALGFHSG
jgi:glycosyltransferase involved in cell wall biosynthesis